MMNRDTPVCDLEMLFKVSPLAVMAMVGLCFDIFKLGSCLPRRALQSLTAYCAGLITLDRKQTSLRISNYLGGISHDRLTRFLGEGEFYCSKLMIHFVHLIQFFRGKGFLILDDTFLLHPRSKKIKGVYWDYDHSLKRKVFGQRLVVLIWSDGFWRIPVAFSFWHKKGARPKYRTKNEIARTLLSWSVHQGLKPDYVTFDNWYASQKNLKLILIDLKLDFVTRIKRNHYLVYQGRRLQARTIGRRVLASSRKYRFKDLGVWARRAEVQVGDLGLMTFVVLKDELDGEKSGIKYLLASTPRLSAREAIRRYKSRWIIETLFWDLKQHLGLSNHQGRKLCASEKHVAAALLSAFVLDHLRFGSGLSLGETKRVLQRLVFVKTEKQGLQLASLQPAPAADLEQMEEMKKIMRKQLWRVSGMKLHSRPLLEKAA